MLQLIVVLLLAGYQLGWGQWKIETNILSLLPTDSQAQANQQQDISQAKSALFQQANQRVLVAISGEKAIPAYYQLANTITSFSGIENESMTVPDISDVIAFYQPYRDSVMTDDYQALLTEPQAINNFVLGKLTQVSDPFVSGSLAISPRLNLADFLATGLTQLQSFETEQGIIVVNKNGLKHYIMPIKVDVDGFSVKQTQAFSQQLQAEFQRLKTKFDVDVLYSGVLFHTAESSQQAEYEMSTFGVISLLAVLLMILAVFRSAKPVNLALLVLAISVVYGLTAVVTLFNQLHLLTLVFAVTLIGIVIDYCFHAFVSFSVSNNSNTIGGIKSIRTALCLGFITTALGYAALIMSPLSLLSQVAVFMIFGLFGALLTVLLLLPYFNLSGKISVTPSVWTLTDKLNIWLTRLHQQRRILFVILSLGFVSAIVLDDINFNDDIRLLNSSPAFLIDNEIKMAKLMGYQHSQRIVITADDSEALLQRQEVLLARLQSEQQQQPDLVVKSIASLLPSVAKQQVNNDQLKDAEQQQVFQQGLAILGLTDTVDEFKPLTLDAFNSGPLQPLSAVYIYQYQSQDANNIDESVDKGAAMKHALWVETSGVALNTDLQQWIATQPDMSIDNKPAEVSAALSHYRQALLLLFAGAILVVTIVLCLRFGLIQGLLGLLSIVVSAGGALLLTQLSLGHLNIFNLLAVLLILALAIDYVIFYQEHGLQRNTVLAITLSAISSALVFGVLALSVTPAVESFGLTVMFGIMLVFLLAPLSAKQVAQVESADTGHDLNDKTIEVVK
ncbi:Putative membrane protein, Predicted exporter [Moritella viscosa]|uniref:Membrane protein, Predicted exporter n=1 Tax=Moritella viscosa TaxID=80854 RepID=A0A1L0B2A7_9GAMM|nr:Putative membrane protein, Predicted exporter [Moritella viscosa]SGY89897.1 Putative membrane protein, Predicted exporter [Moritella viscosa]SGY90450.1 Putative membrane protein, Predicted exporter [Moritella viscosa]SHO00890.1 Putative membrane protein, Predicted exporter [Moritella viscosa]SHO01216.1 Putative membrane protein, Predicted exporter [Moritella viscosa]